VSRILVCGTLAIDWLSRYPGHFSSLPTGTHLNFSMQIGDLSRTFGGCAMNICYSLKLLGDEAFPFVVVGRDYREGYDTHLRRLGIDASGIRVLEREAYSAHAFIFTDLEGNQLTGFYSGPSDQPDERERLERFVSVHRPDYAVLAPDVAPKFLAAAATLRALGTPFLADPGQNLTDFTADETQVLIEAVQQLIVNQYEWQTIQQRLGARADELSRGLDWVVITHGARGAEWRPRAGDPVSVPAVPARRVVDPTGCGDAFRAGFVHAHARGADMTTALRCGALSATINLETHGAQAHDFTEFRTRFRETCGSDLPW